MIMPAAIARRRIDEVNAEIERPMQRRDRFVVIRRAVRAGHAHAAKRQVRDFELRRAKLYVFHECLRLESYRSPTDCVKLLHTVIETISIGRIGRSRTTQLTVSAVISNDGSELAHD